MSISKLRKTVQKRIKVASWILAGLFFLSIPAYFSWGGGGLFGSRGIESGDIGKVNGVEITRDTFEKIFNQEREKYPFASSPDSQLYLRLEVFNNIVDDIILSQAIKKERIKVSDRDVEKYIQQLINEEVERAKKESKAKKFDEKSYRERLKSELEKQKDVLKRELIFKKLREKVESRVKVTEEDLKNSYKEVHLRAIKVNSEQEAQQLLGKAKNQDFSTLAKQYPSSKQNGGDMGWLPIEAFPPDVQNKIKSMQKGDIGILRLGGSYFVAKLEDERLNLPKDFEKNKEKLLKSYEERKKQSALQDYLYDLKSKANIQIYDPLLKAAQALQSGDYNKAKQFIQEGLKLYHDDPNLLYALATVYEKEGKEDEALKLYERVANEVYMGQAFYRMGTILEKRGKTKEAVEAYKKAAQYTGPDILTHYALKEKFAKFGLSQEKKKEEETINRLSASQRAIIGGGNAP